MSNTHAWPVRFAAMIAPLLFCLASLNCADDTSPIACGPTSCTAGQICMYTWACGGGEVDGGADGSSASGAQHCMSDTYACVSQCPAGACCWGSEGRDRATSPSCQFAVPVAGAFESRTMTSFTNHDTVVP